MSTVPSRHRLACSIAALTLAFCAGGTPRAQAVARPASSDTWAIDPSRSEVRFTITKLGFSDVTGVFRDSEGEVRYDAVNPSRSAVRWRVRVASVLTDAPNRDRSLQAPEYFDAARHPHLTFASRVVRALGDGRLEVTGDITIRGTTQPIVIVIRPRMEAAGPTFETDFEIDRYDFDVRGGSVMGRLIGRRVRVHVRAATEAQEAR